MLNGKRFVVGAILSISDCEDRKQGSGGANALITVKLPGVPGKDS